MANLMIDAQSEGPSFVEELLFTLYFHIFLAPLLDWEAYLKIHPDLKGNGITKENQARQHYLKVGRFLGDTIISKRESSSQRMAKVMNYAHEHHNSVRSKIINAIIKKRNYKSYLEVGVSKGKGNFDLINALHKVSVDSGVGGYSEATHTMTSDEFFDQNKETFDIVFCDGLHESVQLSRDIRNALKCLNKGGTIVCHDVNPLLEIHQKIPRQTKAWNGDCWKAFVRLRQERDDLIMSTIDADYGLGIIRKGRQEKLRIAGDLSYKNFDKSRKKWLNLIAVKEFLDVEGIDCRDLHFESAKTKQLSKMTQNAINPR